MGTRGFISIKSGGKIIGAYNHSDSYPSWLGVSMAEFIQRQDVEALAAKIGDVQQVDESAEPTPEQSADLKERGFWQNVSSGRDWYSHLREAQGDLAAYIEAGYIPTFDVPAVLAKSDVFIEWGYVVDADAKVLEVYEYASGPMKKVASLTFDEIRAEGFDTRAVMDEIESAD